MMKTNFKYILILVLMVSVRSFSQTVGLNSVNEAIEYAFKNNPDLEIYKQNQKKAESDYNSVKNYRWPNINASFSGVNNLDLPVTQVPGEIFGQPGRTIEAEFGEKYNYNAGLNISINILDFQSKFSAKVAKLNIEIAEANEEVYKQKLAEQVALYYYTAIITQQALVVLEEDIKTSKNMSELVEQKFEQGMIDQYSVNLAQMNTNTIHQNIYSYRTIYDQCLANLNVLFGTSPETIITFKETLETIDINILPIDFLGPDRSIELYKLQMKQADYRISQARSNWYPKLSINRYIGAQHYRDNFGLSFSDNDWSKVSYISLNLSIPIFNGFSTKNQVTSAIIEYDIAKKTLEQEMLKLQIEDELMIKELNNSRDAASSAKDNYQIAKENADLQFQKFEQGIVSLDKYLDSFDDYLKAEVTYLNLLSDSYQYYSKIISRNL